MKNNFNTPRNAVRIMRKHGEPKTEVFSEILTESRAEAVVRKEGVDKLLSALWFTENGKAVDILKKIK